MQRWAITTLVMALVGLCIILLGLRWWQLAQRAPLPAEPLRLSAALPALAEATLDEERVSGEPSQPARAERESTQATAAAVGTTEEPVEHEDSQPVVDTPPANALVDVNAANAQQLATLPGIGEVLAGRIVAYRQAHGPFKSLDSLLAVDGIGPGKLAKLKPYAIANRK